MLPSFFIINEWLYIERALYEHFHTPDCTFQLNLEGTKRSFSVVYKLVTL